MTLHKPLVSIVTPSFNQAGFLETTMRSVLDQDYDNLEYIVVDGGSTDESVGIIKRYADRLAWWISEPDQGQGDAINKGFLHASGEIWAWLNSDDIYYPGTVARAVECLWNNPEAGMVYADTDLIDASGVVMGRFSARQTDYARMLRGSVHIPQQSTFIRSECWREVGGVDPSFFFAMDFDLWVRLAKITTFRYVPQCWAAFRLHGQGKTTRFDDRCYPEMLRVRERELGKGFSILALKAFLRPFIYAWLPLSMRIWLRNRLPW
jgi:glycosyltransferase involved in cell wall biosynthesis